MLLGVSLLVKDGRNSQDDEGSSKGLALTMWLNAPAPGIDGWTAEDLDVPPAFTFVTGYRSTTGIRPSSFFAMRLVEPAQQADVARTLFDRAFMACFFGFLYELCLLLREELREKFASQIWNLTNIHTYI